MAVITVVIAIARGRVNVDLDGQVQDAEVVYKQPGNHTLNVYRV